MDLGTIVSSVIDATGRPDRETYLRAQINSVLRYLHSQFNFPQDLVESQETVSITSTVINLAVPALMRKVAYLRPLPYNKLLDFVPPSRIINATQKAELTNCYYISGSTFIIRLRNGYQTDTIAFGRYEYPTFPVADTDATWSMGDFDSLIIDILSAKIFRVTGDINSARGLEEGSYGITVRLKQLRDTGNLAVAIPGA